VEAKLLKPRLVGVCYSPKMSVLLGIRNVGLVPEGQICEHSQDSKCADKHLLFLNGLCP